MRIRTPAFTSELIVTVDPAGDAQPVVKRMSTDLENWNIQVVSESELPTQLDLALVIDTTGSMGDELEYLKSEIDSIATTVHEMFPNVDQRYSLIVYRDQGDNYVSRRLRFTSSLDDFRKNLSNQSAAGGGDTPEAMHIGVELAKDLDWRGGNTAKVMFLVGDAPPHGWHAGRTLDAAKELREKSVRIYPLAGSGVHHQAEFIMRAMSFMSMGEYLFLTDHSGVGNSHAAPSVSEYEVERLDRLMIRMISSELAGWRVAADEIIAIESGCVAHPKQVSQQKPSANNVRRNRGSVNKTPTRHNDAFTFVTPVELVSLLFALAAICFAVFMVTITLNDFKKDRVVEGEITYFKTSKSRG